MMGRYVSDDKMFPFTNFILMLTIERNQKGCKSHLTANNGTIHRYCYRKDRGKDLFRTLSFEKNLEISKTTRKTKGKTLGQEIKNFD